MSFIAVGIAAGGAVIGGVASAVGGEIQAGAARGAAATQAQAADRATQLQRDQFNQQRADQAPWRQAGINALGDLQNADFQRDFTQADFQQDPGYAFRMAEGQKALERSKAARGGLQSGGTLKAIARYSQDYASGEYTNAYNRFNADKDRRFGRLSSLAGIGQTANASVAAAGQNYANQAGNNIMGAGNASAAAQIASGNATGNAVAGVGNSLSGLANNWMTLSAMNRQPAFTPSPGAQAVSGGSYFNTSGIA